MSEDRDYELDIIARMAWHGCIKWLLIGFAAGAVVVDVAWWLFR